MTPSLRRSLSLAAHLAAVAPLVAVVATAPLTAQPAAAPAARWEVTSPDGRNRVVLTLDGGVLRYAVAHGRDQVLAPWRSASASRDSPTCAAGSSPPTRRA